jgi:large subunit ribosomal protein L18
MTFSRQDARKKRKVRIRKKISGTLERPRLVVFRSNKHIYAQLVDDTQGRTLAAASTLNLDDQAVGLTMETAKQVGLKIAQEAKKQNITAVVFDRNGFLYHGRVKALADGAREGGLNF